MVSFSLLICTSSKGLWVYVIQICIPQISWFLVCSKMSFLILQFGTDRKRRKMKKGNRWGSGHFFPVEIFSWFMLLHGKWIWLHYYSFFKVKSPPQFYNPPLSFPSLLQPHHPVPVSKAYFLTYFCMIVSYSLQFKYMEFLINYTLLKLRVPHPFLVPLNLRVWFLSEA